MFRSSSKNLCSLLALCAATACVSPGDVPGPPYEVVVLDRVAPESDEFSLQRRQLTSLDDFERLTAPSFRIRQAGVLLAEEIHGDLITAGSFEDDEAPALRYVVEDGVAVPRDYATLLMFSAAYQFESVLGRLAGVVTPSVKNELDARGVVDVILSPEMRLREAGVETSLRINGNAFFFAPGWQFGLAQSSESELAPLAADERVIAHELGHAAFQAAFLGAEEHCEPARAADNERDPWFVGRLDNELVIGAFNEGFADWLSFAVTGGTDPLGSLDGGDDPELTENVRERVLTEDSFGWSDVVKLGGEAAPVRRCRGKYCVGTLFARSLVAAYQATGNTLGDSAARQAYSQKIVAALEGTLPRMLEAELPLPAPELARCELREQVSAELDPPLIGSFMQAFLLGLPPVDAAAVCRAAEARFEAGFPAEYRQECEP
jgi:hypothetical protein